MNKPLAFDFSYIDAMAAGDQMMRATLLETLLSELPVHYLDLQQAVASGETARIFQASHHLKSTLVFLGHEEAIRLNREIEALAREEKSLDLIQRQWEDLSQLLDKIIAVLPSLV